MNKVILIGRLTRDPELRYTQTGKAVCAFGLAVDRYVPKDAPPETQTVDFINCQAWGKLGETISQYCAKGRKIAVEGRLQIRQYTDKEGAKRWSTEVVCNTMEFCEAKKMDGQDNAPLPPEADFGGAPVSDEDIPF